ncbi:MAG TPA: hypothetical protein VF158_06195 [Longimicrobiales bacterium]
MAIDPADERILRAKYLDWCSARVVDRFLELTPDQIYELAHGSSWRGTAQAAGEVRVVAASSADATKPVRRGAGAAPFDLAAGTSAVPSAVEGRGVEGGLGVSYRDLVARITEVLAAEIGLPSFEVWAAAYEKSPEQFEEELLGLWKRRA